MWLILDRTLKDTLRRRRTPLESTKSHNPDVGALFGRRTLHGGLVRCGDRLSCGNDIRIACKRAGLENCCDRAHAVAFGSDVYRDIVGKRHRLKENSKT